MINLIGDISNNLGAFIGIFVGVLVVVVALIIYFAFFHKKVVAKANAKKAQKEQEKLAKQERQDMQNSYIDNVFNKRNAEQNRKTVVDEREEGNVIGIVGKQEKVVVDKNQFKRDNRFVKEDQLADKDVSEVLNISKHYNKQVEGKQQVVDDKKVTSNESEVLDVMKRNDFNQKFEKKNLKIKQEENKNPNTNESDLFKYLNNSQFKDGNN